MFQEKAARYAAALKKTYKLHSLNIGSQGDFSPAPTFRTMAMAADATPMPVDTGESQIVVTIRQIELDN